jgi:chorismate synthase
VTTRHEPTTVKVVGRHDPSVVPRAVPVVEAMLANVLADLYLRNRAARIDWPS